MAKKTKKEGNILTKKDKPVDFKTQKEGEHTWEGKTLEAESKTKLEDDKGFGEAITLRFFDFKANPESFNKKLPTAQELFSAHAKQIEIELWKDEWQPIPEIEPRIMFAKDKSHYRIVIGARPAKGSLLSNASIPKTLTELHGNRS